MRRMFLSYALRLAAVTAFIGVLQLNAAVAGPQFVVALNGYDPVSYFEVEEPQAGSTSHVHFWNGANWMFTSAENMEKFIADPEAYAPAFDGYCAYAASLGYKAPGDPTVWRVVDDTLYLNVSEQAAELWQQDIPGNIEKAEENWPRINPI